MRIDPHVHCRDGAQNYKETIAHVFKLCDQQRVDMIFDMPNTDPPLLGAQNLEERLKLVPQQAAKRYRLFLGATADKRQLEEAVALHKQCQEVVGIKLYAGKSVGSLAVTGEKEQQEIYSILAAAGYTGVLAVHCEKESLFTREFNPDDPRSHSRARPPESETASVRDQIKFAKAAKFGGTLHICHVSTAAALREIKQARLEMKITCGVTPHHLLWSSAQMESPEGLLYKVNPPLREPADNVALRQALKDGEIDWIETDHAPHALSEKLYAPYESGYPALCLYRSLIEEVLPGWGLDQETIKNLTCKNIVKAFGERKTRYDAR